MPKEMWPGLAARVVQEPITMSIRSAEFDGQMLVSAPVTGSIGTFTIAPGPANGTIVYWTSSDVSLKGFALGDESVSVVLEPGQTSGKCVGCHASAPDGILLAHGTSDNPGSGL